MWQPPVLRCFLLKALLSLQNALKKKGGGTTSEKQNSISEAYSVSGARLPPIFQMAPRSEDVMPNFIYRRKQSPYDRKIKVDVCCISFNMVLFIGSCHWKLN